MSTSRWLTWTRDGSTMGKSHGTELPKPTEPGFVGSVGAVSVVSQIIVESPKKVPHPDTDMAAGRRGVSPFPHCPRCASYALYRKNNIGNYECLTCEAQDIPEEVARRVH
jgi:hypothetical protein